MATSGRWCSFFLGVGLFSGAGLGVSAGPLLLGLLRVSECCPGVNGLLCARAMLTHLPAFFWFHGRAGVVMVVLGTFSLCVGRSSMSRRGPSGQLSVEEALPCTDVGGHLRGCVPGDGPLAYATSTLLWLRGPRFLRLGVVVSAGPVILGLVRDSGGLPWADRAALRPGGGTRRALLLSPLPHWQWHWGRGARSLRLGLRTPEA